MYRYHIANTYLLIDRRSWRGVQSLVATPGQYRQTDHHIIRGCSLVPLCDSFNEWRELKKAGSRCHAAPSSETRAVGFLSCPARVVLPLPTAERATRHLICCADTWFHLGQQHIPHESIQETISFGWAFEAFYFEPPASSRSHCPGCHELADPQRGQSHRVGPPTNLGKPVTDHSEPLLCFRLGSKTTKSHGMAFRRVLAVLARTCRPGNPSPLDTASMDTPGLP